MGLFSGLASLVTAHLSMVDDMFIQGENPVESLKSRAQEIDRNFKY